MKEEIKKKKSKFSALWAFLLGIILMLAVYIMFESAPTRLRSGSTNDTADTTSIINTANIVQTAAVEDVSVSPSVFFGVEVLSVNSIIAKQLSLPNECGVLVNGVVDGSPAQKAGLQRGDVIISLDGETVTDTNGFKLLMAKYKPGDSVRIVYIRNGQKNITYAKLVAIPDTSTTAQDSNSSGSVWGISLSDITKTIRSSFGIPVGTNGVVILSVAPGGAADAAGLQPGDVITGINKTPVSGMDEFFSALSSDNDNIALLDVYSQGSVRYVTLDSSGIIAAVNTTPTQTQTMRQRMMSVLTGGVPVANVQLTVGDNPAFNRPSTVPGDENTGGTSSTSGGTTSTTGMNRPSQVPSQLGSTNDTVLFIGLLILLIMYLSYREYTRPTEAKKS